METRRRNYRENPRSPAKRRRQRKTKLNLIAQTQSSNLTNLFPSFSDLPPLPDSPTQSDSNIRTLSPDRSIISNHNSPVFPHISTLPPLPSSPTSLHSEKETHTLEQLDNKVYSHTVENLYRDAKHQPRRNSPVPSSVSSTSEITNKLSLLTINTPYMTTEPTAQMANAQATEDRAISSIIDRMNNLPQMTATFRHLAKDGSNLVQWQDDVERTIYLTTGVRRFWETKKPILESRLDEEKNRAAMIILETTIDESLRQVTKKEDYALDALQALKQNFQKGGRTAQFALFQKLMSLRFDPNETDVLAHTSKINGIYSELKSTGFNLSDDSFKGLLYQLHMPPEMTKEVNKELDSLFKSKAGIFTAVEIRDALQMHVAREKTASETISISNLQTHMNDLSINAISTQNRARNPFTSARSSQMSTPRAQSYTRFTNTPPSKLVKGWNYGPPPITPSADERNASKLNPIPIPDSAINNAKAAEQDLISTIGGNALEVPTTGTV
ncbi:hypothetical protein DFH28DRAFT_1218655 [Melampsora americana]|nr:hypothetical protein DFH28DRAFT_1218655 [Melampsora americana]